MARRHSPAVYRRRRLAATLTALALAGLILWGGWSALGGGHQPVVRPKATASPTAVAPSVGAVPGLVEVATQTAQTPCHPESIRVSPYVPANQQAKSPVTLVLTFTTSAARACTLVPAKADLVVIVSQGDTPVYDSTVCKEALLAEPVPLSPHWSTQVKVQWSGRGSGRACDGTEGFAVPASYRLQIGTLGGEPGTDYFTLTQPPKPEKTPVPIDGEPSGEPQSGQTAKTPG